MLARPGQQGRHLRRHHFGRELRWCAADLQGGAERRHRTLHVARYRRALSQHAAVCQCAGGHERGGTQDLPFAACRSTQPLNGRGAAERSELENRLRRRWRRCLWLELSRSAGMARIIGGIAASHTPTIGFAYDRNKRHDPVRAPIFENFAPLAAWLADKHPDVLLWIYNDHVTSFFFDHYSAFVLGVGPEWPVADEGGGPRDLPAIKGHPQLASHIGHSLMADEFDMSFFQNRALDHGCFSPLSVVCPHEP